MTTLKDPVMVARGSTCNAKLADRESLTDDVVAQLGRMVVDEAKRSASRNKKKGTPGADDAKEGGAKRDAWNPADFFRLQSLRTSALARKTETTIKFGGTASYDARRDAPATTTSKQHEDKLEGPASEPEAKKTESKEHDEGYDEESDADPDLVARTPGPIRGVARTHAVGPYPARVALGYLPPEQQQPCGYTAYRSYNGDVMPPQQCCNGGYYNGYQHPYNKSHYDAVNQTPVYNSDYGYLHNAIHSTGGVDMCNNKTETSPVQEGLDRCQKSATDEKQALNNKYMLPTAAISVGEFDRLLDISTELPEALSDFILQYSRRYTNNKTAEPHEEHCEPRKDSLSGESEASGSARTNAASRPTSVTDGSPFSDNYGSPFSAGSVPLQSPDGPATATAAASPSTTPPATIQGGRTPTVPKESRGARATIRSMFSDYEMAEAWAWAVKCTQNAPGNFYYCDPDGDSLLHICVWHKDLAKVYALVQQMLKTEFPPYRKPFDIPNRLHETPLLLAVEKRSVEMVRYLLEAGADTNYRCQRPGAGDAPLHFAASRGMTDIVDALCHAPHVQLDAQNAAGLTPIICAVRNHGIMEEESQCLVNSKPTIRTLLKAGADAKIQDATNGRTVLHYAVERMDPELIEIFTANMDGERMLELVNVADFNGETPLEMIQRRRDDVASEAEEQIRDKMYLALFTATIAPN